jgi:hypothetical protein
VGISAGAVAVGAGLRAALGVMLSDPQVTWSAVRNVLPPSLVYDVILSPFVLYGVVRLSAWAGRAAGGHEGAEVAAPVPASWLAGAAAPVTGAVRQTAAAGSPRLHLGERRSSDGWIGAVGAVSAARLVGSQRPPGKQPKLRFRGAAKGAGGTAGLGGGQRPARRRQPKLRFRGASASGLTGTKLTGTKSAPRRMRFLAPRRRAGWFGGGGKAGGGAVRAGAGAVPRFRRRRLTATIGTGGSLSRARRGALGRRSAPRLRMRRGTVRSKVRRLVGRGTGGYR